MSHNPQCSSQNKNSINQTLQVPEGHSHIAEQSFLNARLKHVSPVTFSPLTCCS